jgi:hypothetical protein
MRTEQRIKEVAHEFHHGLALLRRARLVFLNERVVLCGGDVVNLIK